MNWRVLMVAAAILAAVTAVDGCSRTVGGAPARVTEQADPTAHRYGYTEDRCGLLADVTVQELVGADKVVRPYSGAVCQYILIKQSIFVDLTYSWFETGSLDRERAQAQANRAQITDALVERHQAFTARRAVTGNACSATAATNPGVASWWVQIRGESPIDPCQQAQELLSKTLASDL
jgi:hypothetical protein